MTDEEKQEIQKMIHAEVRNALHGVLEEQNKENKENLDKAVEQLTTQLDAMFGKYSRAQAIVEKSVESLKKTTESIVEDLSDEKSKISQTLEKITKMEYVSLDAETSTKVKSFVKAPVKYLVKVFAGIE